MGRTAHRKPRFRTVADAMAALDMTDAQVAEYVGCDRSRITRIRQGEPFLSLALPLKLVRLLRVPIESLYDETAA